MRPVAEKETKDSPPVPPPGEGVVRSPSTEDQTSPSLGRPSQGACFDACRLVWRGPGRAGRLPCGRLHGAAWLEAAARERGRRQGGGSSCTPRQDVPDCLSLLLCSGELLGEVLRRVAEQAGLGHGGIQELCLVYLLHVGQTQPEVAFLDHHGGHRTAQRPRRNLHRS